MQLRVQSAGSRVQERRANQIAGGAILILDARLADARGGKLLQLAQRHGGRFLMGLDDTPVIHRDRENRHRLGRRTDEIEVEPTAAELLRSELFASHRVQVIAEPQERFSGDGLTRHQS